MIRCGLRQMVKQLGEWPDKLTNELKFTGHKTLCDYAVGLLDTNSLPDPKYPFGEVNSIYYDTLQKNYLSEKKEGDNLKQKVRLRWYTPESDAVPSEVPAFIEVKNRIGSARDKSRHQVSAPYPWIKDSGLDHLSLARFLYRHAGSLIEPIPMNLVPIVCVSYKRRRYVCPQTGSRIALDYDIRAERFNPNLFPALNSVYLDNIVCEFKHTGKILPGWVENFYCGGFRLRSFSKFGECINQILHGGIPV